MSTNPETIASVLVLLDETERMSKRTVQEIERIRPDIIGTLYDELEHLIALYKVLFVYQDFVRATCDVLQQDLVERGVNG